MGRKNLFKDKKIIFLLRNNWFDGSSYKFPKLLQKEFGIDYTREGIRGDCDLGICKGDFSIQYKDFMMKKIPYLLLEHDVMSLRFGLNEKTYAHDKEKIENAVAVIFTSENHAEYYERLKKEYKWYLPEYMVIYNKPLKEDINFIPREKLEGLNLVYAGGLVAQCGSLNKGRGYHYRANHYVFEKFIKAGWKIHLYPNRNVIDSRLEGYRNMGCVIHGWVNGDIIYQEMSQYTAGLHSYNRVNTPDIAFEYTQSCRPNKLYDYLASGIPTIGYDGGNGMEVYRDKWGIVIDDLEPETLKAIPERLKKIKITKKMRYDNVLEKERDKFEYIIDVALKEAGKKDRKSFTIDKNPFVIAKSKNPFERAFPIMVTVENKTPYIIDRLNRAFLPYSISEPFGVDKDDYKQLRAHVNLRIKEVGGQ